MEGTTLITLPYAFTLGLWHKARIECLPSHSRASHSVKRCEQNPHTSHFLVFVRTHDNVSHDIGSRCQCASCYHVSCACVFDLSSTLSSHISFVSPIFYFILLIFHFICALPRMKSLVLWSTTPLSHVLSPTSSTTTTSQRPLKFASDTRPSYLHDSEISDDTIGRALSSPLFTLKREEPAGRRQAYHSPEESLLSSQSLSVGHVRTGRPVNELSSLSLSVRENPCRDSENEQIRILLERQKILADCRAEIQKHEFQADYDRRSIQKLNGVIESQRGEINRGLARDEQLRRDQQLLHEQLLEQNRELREVHVKILNEMEELKRFQGSTFDTIARKKLIEDRHTILELTAKIQELQNEVECLNDSREF